MLRVKSGGGAAGNGLRLLAHIPLSGGGDLAIGQVGRLPSYARFLLVAGLESWLAPVHCVPGWRAVWLPSGLKAD